MAAFDVECSIDIPDMNFDQAQELFARHGLAFKCVFREYCARGGPIYNLFVERRERVLLLEFKTTSASGFAFFHAPNASSEKKTRWEWIDELVGLKKVKIQNIFAVTARN